MSESLSNTDTFSIITEDDISHGVERIPVPIEKHLSALNTSDFVYIRSSIPGPTIDRAPWRDNYAGCSCIDNCSTNCPCVDRFGGNYDSNGRLIDDSRPLIECNKNCSCPPSCSERLVQHGLKRRLLVCDAGTRGRGLRVLENVSRGSFVCEYAGEVLSAEEAKTRLETVAKQDAANYLVVLREHSGSKVTNSYVDATYLGNVARFINHSCEPNLLITPVRVHHQLARLALFAKRDILKNEELTFDYGNNFQSNPNIQNESRSENDKSKTGDDNRTENSDDDNNSRNVRKDCLCGSGNCRGLLPFDGTLFDSVS